MQRRAAVTICSANYLPRAIVLFESYRTHHPQDAFYLVLVDRPTAIAAVERPDLHVLWAEELGLDDFLSHAFAFDVIELSTNIKPRVLQRLLTTHDVVVYLDPDIDIVAPLDPVWRALESAPIVVTPHYNTPVVDGKQPDDLDLLKFGPFNLGFLAVAASAESNAFLEWWSSRCLRFGFYEPQIGLAVDQKWISLVPCFFPGTRILHDVGLNVAFWNLHERRISCVDGQWMVNDVTPLRFVHFSSFDATNADVVAHKQSRFPPGSRPDFRPLSEAYAARLAMAGHGELSNAAYSYDFMDDGARITPALRRFYAGLRESAFAAIENPFARDGQVQRFAERYRLLEQAGEAGRRHTFRDASAYAWHAKVILRGLRVALFVLGPTRYFNLMRYLAHVSSLRNQADMFSVPS